MDPVPLISVVKHHLVWVVLSGLLGLLALALAVWALVQVLGPKREQAGTGAGVAAIIAACGAGVGLGGSMVARYAVHAIWSMTTLSPKEMRQITELGYGEARQLVFLGAAAVALPLIMSLAVALKAGTGRALAGLGALATIGSVAAGIWLTRPDAGFAALDAHAAARVGGVIDAKDCDACPVVAWGIDLLGADALEKAAPGALAVAKACIDLDLKAIAADHYPIHDRVCTTSDAVPPPPLEEAPGMRLGGKTMTPSEKVGVLVELLASPLAVDGDQRRAIETMIEEAKQAAARKPVVRPPSGSFPPNGPQNEATVVLGGTGVTGGKVANASTVVARMRGRFRRCYQAGLSKDPDIAGSVTLTAKLGPEGEVQSVAGGGGSGTSVIVPCLKAVISSGGFAPPEGGAAVVTIVMQLSVASE